MHRRDVLQRGFGLLMALGGGSVLAGRVVAEGSPEGLDPGTGLFVDDRVLGNPDAKVVLIEYASLSCPHCAAFSATIMPKLKTDWIDTGKVFYVYRHYPLNAPALWGAMVAECLQGPAFFAFIDILFKQQQQWLAAEDIKAALFELAQFAGFDKARFDKCAEDEAMLDKILGRMEHGGTTYDIQGTPTVVVNGEVLDHVESYEELLLAIEDAAD